MRRDQVQELHYITPIANVPSILTHGILSHRRAARLDHDSVAMAAIQERRARVVIPGGRPLHEYANLYFHARNPMMYKRLGEYARICVLRISTDVLELANVVIADQNAASRYARFGPSPAALARLDRDLVFAQDWRDPDQIMKWRRASAKCAEVLVPDRVCPEHIAGAYVANPAARTTLRQLAPSLTIVVNADLFFR